MKYSHLCKLMALSLVCLCLGGCSLVRGTFPVPAPTPSPTAAPKPRSTPVPLPEIAAESVEGVADMDLTVVFDNNEYDPNLGTAWGFGCVINYGERRILFDTAGDGPLLLSNMSKLGIDLAAIEVVVLSHIHGDHTDGLSSILEAGGRPIVYVPQSFPESLKTQVRELTELREINGAGEICKGVYTTGEVMGDVREQALALETAKGKVVVTGCAHPGVDTLARVARETTEGDVYLVLGGFHLRSASASKAERILDDLQEMGVERVAPCHCTGEQATADVRRAVWGRPYPVWCGIQAVCGELG